MITRSVVLPLLFAAALPLMARTYYLTDSFSSINTTHWQRNGTVSASSQGLTATDPNGGALISRVAVPDGTTEYEIHTSFRVPANTTTVPLTVGSFVTYYRATSDARLVPGGTSTGSFYALEYAPVVQPNNGLCAATVRLLRHNGGVLTVLDQWTNVRCTVDDPATTGTVETTVLRHYVKNNSLHALSDPLGACCMLSNDVVVPTGQPGVGGHALVSGASLRQARLAVMDRTAPPAITTPAVQSFGDRVQMRWNGVVDDPVEGVGLYVYGVYRNGTFVTNVYEPAFEDQAVTDSTNYTYEIRAADQALNASAPLSFAVATPPAGTLDPRRTGLHPHGDTWGALGESLDLLTGNVHVSVPLFTVRGRNGLNVPITLHYDAQHWRKDNGGVWQLGRDVGYGYGWRLSLPSITPVYAAWYTVAHYVYTDPSGGEHRLQVNADNTWSPRDGVRVTYDPATRKLWTNDGTFWLMAAESTGRESDAGTFHPTLVQDRNGNQIRLRYGAGTQTALPDSSARLTETVDVRSGTAGNWTHRIDYIPDLGPTPPRVYSIESAVFSGENYIFLYHPYRTLKSPFTGTTTRAETVSLLHWIERNGSQGVRQVFHYPLETDGQGKELSTGEMSAMDLPLGGRLEWDYRQFTFASGLTVREANVRRLKPNGASGPTLTYNLLREDGTDSVLQRHSSAQIVDASGQGDKHWFFHVNTSAPATYGRLQSLSERAYPNVGTILRRVEPTWATDAAGHPYVSATTTHQNYTLNGSADPNRKTSRVEQVVDQYGNPTTVRHYGYGSLTTPERTYTNTYLTGTGYQSRYLRSRPLVSSVTNGTSTVTLQTNTYDQYGAMGGCPNRGTLGTVSGAGLHDGAAYGSGMLTRGNMAMVQVPGGTTCLAHNVLGGTTGSSDIHGHSSATSFHANSFFAVPTVVTPNGLANLQTSHAYNGALQRTSTTQPNAATTSHTYQLDGRPATTTAAVGATATFAYQDLQRQSTTTVNGRVTRTTRDGLGRTVRVEQLDANSVVRTIVDTEYLAAGASPLGGVRRISQPYAPGGTVHWTTYAYDALGRATSVSLAGNSGTTTTAYAGATVTVTNPKGQWRKYTSDASGNLLKVTEPNPAGGADHVTDYTYTMLGQLKTATMSRSGHTQTRTFTYHSTTQRLTSVTTPEAGTVSYVYNNDGTLFRRTDQKGQKVEWTYDTLGRTTIVKRFAAGSSTDDACQRVTYGYDTNTLSSTFTQNGQGRLVTAQYGDPACAAKGWVEMYSYSSAGLITAKRLRHQRGTANANLDAGWAYDNEGRLTTLTYPAAWTLSDPTVAVAAATLTYSYDAMGRPNGLTEMQDRLVTHAKDVAYGPAGELTALAYLNQKGATAGADTFHSETRLYNARLQLTRMTVPGVVDHELRYSATQNDGRIESRKDWVSGEDVAYQYDSLQRLISAVTTHTGGTAPPWGLSFSYDGFGNKTGQTVTQGTGPHQALTIDPASNRVVGSGIGYDGNGNTTLQNGVTLGYDVENRLVTTSTSEQYGYAPDSRRVWRKKADGTEDVYFYGVGGERMVTYRVYTSGTTTLKFLEQHRNVFFAGRMIRAENTPFVANQVGSAVSEGRRYYPFGEEATTTAQDRTKFGTYHRDSTTGLDYADQRYYTNQWGRFMTPDPGLAGTRPMDPQSWNRYAYAENNPIGNNDPSGLDCRRTAQCVEVSDTYAPVATIGWGDNHHFDMAQSLAIAPLDFSYGGGAVTSFSSLEPAPMMDSVVAEILGALGEIDAAAADFAETIDPIANNPVVDTVNTIGSFALIAVQPYLATITGTGALTTLGLGLTGPAVRGGLGGLGMGASSSVFQSRITAGGGTLYTTTGDVTQPQVAGLMNRLSYTQSGQINVLSGVHGHPNGTVSPYLKFFRDDQAVFGNLPSVTVYDYSTLTGTQVQQMVNGPGTTVGAFCYSGPCLSQFIIQP